MSIEKLQLPATLDQERIDTLKSLLPEAVADGKFNFDTLRDLLADAVEDDFQDAEHFGLTWPGKRESRRLAALPSKGTLAPVPGEGVDEEKTENIFIEGENLEVLKILKKSYAGKIKMVYIDPPYNTGQDFIYKDDYSEPLESYLRRTGQADEEGKLLVSNTKADGRFHSNWLSMIYPRLKLARELLRDDGAIFVSIDDNEVHNLRQVMNEVFGEDNFIAELVWQKSKKGDAKLVSKTHEYVMIFGKSKETLIDRGNWRRKKPGADEVLAQYEEFKRKHRSNHNEISEAMREWYSSLAKDDPRRAHQHYRWSDARGLYFADNFAGPDDGRKSRPRYDIPHPVTGKPCKKPSTGWRWEEERTNQALSLDPPLIHFGPDETTIPCRKSYLFEINVEPITSVFYRDGRAATLEVESLVGKGLFDFPKNADVIKDFLQVMHDPDAIILDCFAGSGSTAQAVMQLNNDDQSYRRFICVQLPEPLDEERREKYTAFRTLADVAVERIRQASEKIRQRDRNKLALDGYSPDSGFRVLKLTSSNFRRWQDQEEENVGGLILQAEQKALTPLIDGAKEADVLTEIALLEGFALSAKQPRAEAFTRNKVTCITDSFNAHQLYVCLDRELWEETIDQVEQLPTESVFYCFDNALSDAAKIQLAESCRVVTI